MRGVVQAMTVPGCIAAGVDLGPDSERVIAYAAGFASATDTPVRLLYVIDFLLTPPSYLSAYIEEERKHEEAELRRWKSRLQELGIEAEYSIVVGRLDESFEKVVGESASRLLVIGYQSHVIRPSSSERLVKRLRVPMLVVRGAVSNEAAVGSVRIGTILCPVDFSEGSRKAISVARMYAGLFSAKLQVMHVIPSHVMKEKWTPWKRLSPREKEDVYRSLNADAGNRLREFCRVCGVEGEAEILHGHPAEVIASRAEAGHYDLIVMGARGLSYVESALIGGTADAVLRSSPCPVLIAR
jgi:nucleotide-binding universal stress UspA family protein